MRRRPLRFREAILAAFLLHLLVLGMVVLSLHRAAAQPLSVTEPLRSKPVRFRFVERPQPEQPPRTENAPASDVDQRASTPFPPDTQPPENTQPRTEGDTSELIAEALLPPPRIPPPRRKPATQDPTSPEDVAPSEEKPLLEEKRRELLSELARLQSADLLGERLDNPRGDFFQGPSDAAISFDAKGVEWGPYARRIHRIVKRNWIIPPAAQVGVQGIVRIRFEILRDGTINALDLVSGSGTRSLDDAAWAAVSNSHPLPPPPLPEGDDEVGVQFNFYYNVPLPH
jgi:TonB family protein